MARNNVSRRDFVKTSAAIGAGYWVAGGLASKASAMANGQIQFACIGFGGKGGSDFKDAGDNGKIVAVCDVDDKAVAKAAAKYKGSEKFSDYREMLERMGKSIDAVTVSTPDHNHAAVSLLYMRAGKHCFCQKPLTRTIYEADLMGRVAADMKVATQMGNQGTANDSLRKVAALIRGGAVGDVKEVHVWTNRPIWPQGGNRPTPKAPPKELHWDLWLGTAKARPFGEGIHPFKWRGFWDFGSGALGDMACHTVNMPFMALDLFDPISVEAESSGNNTLMYPNWSIIKFEFPKNDSRPALSLTWYDGGKRPKDELFEGKTPAISGALVVGDKGKLYAPGDYCENPHTLMGGAQEPKVEFPKSPGHFEEWVRAIKTNNAEPAMSNFPSYASRLTKTILLGNLAVWAGTKVNWDAKAMKGTTGLPELDAELQGIVRPTYRQGYVLEETRLTSR
ncbi:MAG TPA: Gfo/Idh/MocA family oxidoreductase [Pirellulales bacterium]|jgi:predicted dehydrogenase|nr:Gfo/Idh/MocA family oxidoreductase [Pirellulales bacterium]